MSTLARDERKSARRTAWILAVVVICIYVGYIAWNLLRGSAVGGS